MMRSPPRRRPVHVGYLSGTPVAGFWGYFERDFGDPRTEPAPVVTPSAVGGVTLPFRCPHCGQVAPQLASAIGRRKFADPRPGRQGVYWCPLCRGRMRLDLPGTPLDGPLPAGSGAAPARVDWGGGRVEVVGGRPGLLARLLRPSRTGLDVLGARHLSASATTTVGRTYRNLWR